MDFRQLSQKNSLTSQAAEDKLTKSGIRETHCQKVYTAIRNHCNGGTSREIAEHTGLDHEQTRKRLYDLLDNQWIREGDARECEVTGQEMKTWYVL